MTTNNMPSNFEAEQSVIGSLLLDAYDDQARMAIDELLEDSFFNSAHRIIFLVIKSRVEKKEDVSLISVTDELTKINKIVQCGGFVYVAETMNSVLSRSTLSTYVKLLNKLNSTRAILRLSNRIIELSHSEEPEALINHIEEGLKGVIGGNQARDINHISDFGNEWLDKFEATIANRGGISGLSTGIQELDDALSGFDKEGLFILAGRPSMGKTLLAQTIIENVSDRGESCMFFSLEMSGTQVYQRFVSKISGVCPKKIRSGTDVTNEDWGRISTAVGKLNDSAIYIDIEQKLSIEQIRARVRRKINKSGKQALIVIDYLGLMKMPKADRHDIAIGQITSSLKSLAKEIETPILLLVQGSRNMDKTKRPTMSDLKDSSSIEADADVVMFVHREEVINPDTELKGVTELIIAKDRHNDGNGTIYLTKCNGGFTSMNIAELSRMQHLEDSKNAPKKRGYARD